MSGKELAFPMNGRDRDDHGLTKREYFAGQALAAMVDVASRGKESKTWAQIAEAAVAVADALIAELAKGKA